MVDPSIAERLSGRAESASEDRVVLDMMAQGLGYEEMAAHSAPRRRPSTGV